MSPRSAEMVGEVLAAFLLLPFALSVALLADVLLPYLHKRGILVSKLQLRRSLYGMRDRGLIVQDEGSKSWRLTERGKRRVRTYAIDDLTLPPRPETWDGRWRLIAFDVPEQSKHLRALFRSKLQELGFAYVQRSLWVYPFPCEQELEDLAHRLGLEQDIVIAVTRSLQPTQRLLKRFQLVPPSSSSGPEQEVQ